MTNPIQDGWDWPYIMYVGRKWLGYTEEQLWHLTPLQFSSQLKVHKDITQQLYGSSSKQPPAAGGFIDQISGW